MPPSRAAGRARRHTPSPRRDPSDRAPVDRAQEFPWPNPSEEAAREGLYGWELYAELSVDPTGLSLPILMEELFWGCAGIGLSIVMPALALAAIRQAATDEQLVQWAPAVLRHPGRYQARGPRGDRAERRQRHPFDPDRSSQGRRGLGARRPEGLHRQRRDRGRPRRRGHRRPAGRPSRPGRVHRPQGHAGPDHAAQARQARLPGLAYRRDRAGGLPRPGRVPARRRRATGAADRQGARVRARTPAAGPRRGGRPRRSGPATQLGRTGSLERTRPMVAAQGIGIARAALEFARDYAVQREAFGRGDHREPGRRLPARRPRSRHRRRPAVDLAGRLDGRPAPALRERRGIDVQAQGLRSGGPGLPSRRSRRWAAGAT